MSTRQATPGPSNGNPLQIPQTNSKKRTMSEGDIDGDSPVNQKKVKKDTNIAEVAFGQAASQNKDKKKRRRKKRKLSVVLTAGIESDAPRARSKSKPRSATATVQPPVRASVSDTKSSVNIEYPEVAGGTSQVVDQNNASPVTILEDKGKGKAVQSCDESQSQTRSTSIESPEAQIARLTKELDAKSLLLQKHQAHLTHVHQSLICQICLDLLHKPFAMAPCGHVACHGCLVRWFTSPSGENPTPRNVGNAELSHVNKRKTCPICRTIVAERPVEVWSIKGMVGNIVRSGLVELVVPPPATGDDVPTQGPNGNPDPWRNIFRPAGRSRPYFDFFGALPTSNVDENVPRGDLAEMGMYDAEDGGIYRCIDCMNEIWDGTCTGCRRTYAGHQAVDDADDALSEDDAGRDRTFGRSYSSRGRMLRDFINMLSRGGSAEFDPEEDESDLEFGDGMFDPEDDGDDDEAAPIGEGYGDFVGGLNAPLAPPLTFSPTGFEVFAEFTDEDTGSGDSGEENGIVATDDDEDDYDSSFIDDDNDGIADVDATRNEVAERPRRRATRSNLASRIDPDPGPGSDPIVVSDVGGDGEDAVVENRARNLGRNARLRRRSVNRRDVTRINGSRAIVLDSSDESSFSDIGIIGGPTRNRFRGGQRRRRRIEQSSDQVDESLDAEELEEGSEDDERETYGDDGSVPGPASRLRWLMDDGEL